MVIVYCLLPVSISDQYQPITYEFVVTFPSLVLGTGNRRKTQECPSQKNTSLTLAFHHCSWLQRGHTKTGNAHSLASNQNALALVTHNMEIRSQETNTSWGWRMVSPGLQLQLHNYIEFVQYLLHNSQNWTWSEEGFPGFPYRFDRIAIYDWCFWFCPMVWFDLI